MDRTELAILPSPRRPHRSRGFTLIETGFVIMLMGVGVLAVLELLAAGTDANATGAQTTNAVQLANNVREIAIGLPFFDPDAPSQWSSREPAVAQYDNLLDLDGQTFSPPLDVRRVPIASLAGWSQRVEVTPVTDHDYSLTQPKTSSARCARVTVRVEHHGRVAYERSWIAAAPHTD